MNIRPRSSFRKSLLLVSLFLGAFFAFGAGTLLTVHAQKGDVGGLSSMTTVQRNGKTIEKYAINAPPTPPASFDAKSTIFNAAAPGALSTSKTLSVPAYDWVFGCSSVSGAMIAGYYDLNGYPNIYTGPANGGNAPMNNSTTYWPGWSDGIDPYPNLPLAASHQGIDGRGVSVKGSIDDYWVSYGSSAPDPYIGHGTQHTWVDGFAIGDYMKTSQSAYGNPDGQSLFYTLPNATRLQCSSMTSDDATLGRKQFYEARGYTVTDCYNQHTDNIYTSGFSYAQYKAEIDAGRPVMLNLSTPPYGHTVVGVGYDDSTNSIIIHDTWILNNDWVNVNHTMAWGGSYGDPLHQMQLSSVSIVNLAPPPPPPSFNKVNPANAGTSTRNVTLSWQTSILADAYYYCIDQTPGTTCDSSWITTNTNTSVSVGPLALGTHYWQVYAHNSVGDTNANNGTWFSFTVVQGKQVFLPLISKPVPPPGTFGKILPVINATGQPTSLTLTWGTSSGAVSYEYCLGTSPCTAGSTWNPVSITSASPGTLIAGTTYYWQVRAKNTGGYTYADGGNEWTFTTASTSGSWTTILSENFEGSFPESNWALFDNGYGWSKRSCRVYSGSYSGWIVGGGTSGGSLGCGNNYPISSNSWMVYGPFDLTNATAADLSFKIWINSGNNGPSADTNDVLCARASLDNDWFYGTCWWGSSDWFSGSLDLSDLGTLGSALGQGQVWIAFEFHTNGDSTTYPEGGYVDNIVLRKCTSASCVGGTSSTDSRNSYPNNGFSEMRRPK